MTFFVFCLLLRTWINYTQQFYHRVHLRQKKRGKLAFVTGYCPFYEMDKLLRISIVEYIECVLDKLSNVKECCYEPISWVEDQYKKYANLKRQSHHAELFEAAESCSRVTMLEDQ